MKTSILAVVALAASAYAGASEEYHRMHGTDIVRHRRHHARRATSSTPINGLKSRRSKKCKAKSSSSGSASTSTVSSTSSSSSSTSNSTSSSTSATYPSGVASTQDLVLGMLPDGGSDGGPQNTMAQLNQAASATFGTYGQYSQAQSGTLFDGSQLLQVMDDLKASGAIFEPAVMPTGGWWGLTADDNQQAVAICNVMKQFTDEGITVRLRFAHEVNWYQTDGTYTGGVAEFKAGWAAVAAACKQIAPDVKMFFTPNSADIGTYEEFMPDPSTVDYIGVDHYPDQGDISDAVDAYKPFHDAYCSQGIQFAIGETGLGYAGPVSDRISWLTNIASAKSSMSCFESMSWFNYIKGYDFKVVDPADSSTTSAFTQMLSS